LVVLMVALGAGVVWWWSRGEAAVLAPFAKVARQTLVSTVVTNGRVEPAEFRSIRAPQAGVVERVLVRKGDRVGAGALLGEFSARQARLDLQAAEARLEQARAELAGLERGGAESARTEVDNQAAATRLELDNARREAEVTARLVERNAETREALALARQRVARLEEDMRAIERRRQSLVPQAGREAAAARVKEAEAAVELARARLGQARVLSPVAGTIYLLAMKPGMFVQPGDVLAEVGETDTVRTVVYVDEPELGKVARGMPVTIQWDAMPGRKWEGKVEEMPSQIVTLNTRQVGEVVCRIDNREGLLPPGANVNAEIRSAVAENVLSIPKAALRRGEKGPGVLVLVGDRVEFREVELGVVSVTHAEVRSGLREGDAVALPGEVTLEPGMRVNPQLP
jgi:HlyD family secretion protein